MAHASPRFEAIGTTCSVVVTDQAALEMAVSIALDELRTLDEAASRFRPDSELSRLHARASDSDVLAVISDKLATVLADALDAADRSDGLVDLTVGNALIEAGYDRDFDELQQGSGGHAHGPVLGWRRLRLDRANRLLALPRGTTLDLGAIGKAACADAVAARLASELPGGFLVDLGGDLACSGDLPEGGWTIAVEDARGRTDELFATFGFGVATSSTRRRRWRSADGSERHHIIDPRTGLCAEPIWAQVTCAAETCTLANTAATAAVVLGDEAEAWLEQRGIAARLERADGTVRYTSRWPSEARRPQEAAA